MMAIDNPDLSLRNLNNLQTKITNDTANINDYEELDALISLVSGIPNYIKKFLSDNGIRDFSHYLAIKSEKNSPDKLKLGLVNGTIMGSIDFLKNYAIKNKFYL